MYRQIIEISTKNSSRQLILSHFIFLLDKSYVLILVGFG